MRAISLDTLGDLLRLADIAPELPLQIAPLDEAVILVLYSADGKQTGVDPPDSAVLFSESDFACSEFASLLSDVAEDPEPLDEASEAELNGLTSWVKTVKSNG